MTRARVVGIVGPTASGKSALGLELARRVGGEIVSADARQIYRGLDVGTAKPTAAERAAVPHHCLDLAAPNESFDVGRYGAAARAAIADVVERGRPVVLVGGTGLYVRALLNGLCDGVPAHPALRALLTAMETRAPRTLGRWAARLDPTAAARIHAHDVVRLVRVIEVALETGERLSDRQRRNGFADRPYDVLLIGLATERDALLATLACHAATRVGDHLDPDEARALLAAMDGVPVNAHCPHGRPVAVQLRRPQVEALFGR